MPVVLGADSSPGTAAWVDAAQFNDLLNLEGNSGKALVTEFQEAVTAARYTDLYLQPTWGVSSFRDGTTVSGGGSVTSSVTGEIEVACSAAASDSAAIITLARASYIAGSQGQVGLGIRIPTAATGNQEAQWGLFGDGNGFGFGQDATGMFIFYRSGGSETRVYQANWNIDTADGTGASGRTLRPQAGVIYHVDFVWYGYGSLVYSVFVDDGAAGVKTRVPVHQLTPDERLSIQDPNQPLQVRCSNGASGGAYSIFIGGRQFSLYAGEINKLKRAFEEPVYNIALSTAWLPILAIRKKANFNGRPNSVRVFAQGIEALAADNIEFKVTIGGVVNGGVWSAPTEVAASETAIEVQANPTLSSTGNVFQRAFLAGAAARASSSVQSEEQIELGNSTEIILFARAFTGTPTLTAASLSWIERW